MNVPVSWSRLKRCAPQARQKHFSFPPAGGIQPARSSSPCTSVSASPSINACADDDVPVRR